jgi:hypothetical protein
LKTYTYKAKDGTLITGIPEDVKTDDPRLYERYKQMKASGQTSGAFSGKPNGPPMPAQGAPTPKPQTAESFTNLLQNPLNLPADKPAAEIDPNDPRLQPSNQMSYGVIRPHPETHEGQVEPSGNFIPTAEEAKNQLPHEMGSAIRGITQGLLTVPAVLTDALSSIANLALPDELKAAPFNEVLNMLITKLGVPEAETKAQKTLQAATSGLFSGGGSSLAGKAIQYGQPALQAAPTLLTAIGQSTAAAPGVQALSGAGAEAATEIAAQKGASPLVQMAAGFSGGLLGGGLGGIKKPKKTSTELLQRAAKGNKSAQTAVAKVSAINKDALDSAERLGIDLPVDVFSDNPQLRAAAGLGRSVAGSQSEAQWKDTVTRAIDKADQIIQEAGATFSEGSAAPAVTSARVKDSLLSTRADLSKQAAQIYSEIDTRVPKTAPASFKKLKETLDTIIEEVGKEGMSSQEKKLMDMVSDKNTTYGRLIREKNLIGQAIAKNDSPYGNMEAGSLKRIYGALAEDQLDTVSILGNEALKEQLSKANILYGKERELGKQIVAAFGKDQAGSIADKMKAAITSSGKGDTGAYTRLLQTIPPELQKDVIATALASVAKSGRGLDSGNFGFSEYAKMYKGIRSNPEVYKSMVKTLGNDADGLLRDLYEVSRRITDARANVLQTGKANQAYLRGMVSENFLQKLLESPIGRNVTMMAGTAAGGATAGPFGAAAGAGLASSLLESLARSDKKTAALLGDLFKNEKFQGLMIKLSTGMEIDPQDIKLLAETPKLSAFAKIKGIDPSEQAAWLMNIIKSSQPRDNTEEQEEEARANER